MASWLAIGKGLKILTVPLVKKAVKIARPLVKKTAETASPLVKRTAEAASPLVTKVVDTATPLVKKTVETTTPLVTKVVDTAKPFVTKVVDTATPFVTKVVDTATPLVKKTVETTIPLVKRAVDTATPLVTKVVDTALKAAVVKDVLNAVDATDNEAGGSTFETMTSAAATAIVGLDLEDIAAFTYVTVKGVKYVISRSKNDQCNNSKVADTHASPLVTKAVGTETPLVTNAVGTDTPLVTKAVGTETPLEEKTPPLVKKVVKIATPFVINAAIRKAVKMVKNARQDAAETGPTPEGNATDDVKVECIIVREADRDTFDLETLSALVAGATGVDPEDIAELTIMRGEGIRHVIALSKKDQSQGEDKIE